MTSISVIVPLFNEEAGVTQLETRLRNPLARLREWGPVELLLVDDGSRDDTHARLNDAFREWPSVRLLKHEKNRGVGAAVRTGFGAATGDFVFTLDSDLTYDPNEMGRFLEKLVSENKDIVVASPYHPDGEVVGVPSWRLFLSRTASRIYRGLLSSPLYTYSSLFRVQRRRVVEDVRFGSDGFLGVTEFLVRALRKGYRVGEIPLRLETRRFGFSKMRTLPVMWSHLKLMCQLMGLERNRL